MAGGAAERPQDAVTPAEFRGVTRPARFPTTRPAHARRDRRRSVAATTCSRRGARSPSSCRPQGSRRGGWRSSRTAAGRGDAGGIPRGHETRAFSDDETGARTTRSATLGRSNDVLAARRSLAVVVSARGSRRGGWRSSRTAAGRVDAGGIPRGHKTRAFSDDETGARTTRSATLGRSNDVLAARRSLAVVVSAPREPARWLAEQQNGRRTR